MNMKKILFVIFPIRSHYLASFGLATLLKQRGYTIFFTGPIQFKSLIVENGFEFIELGSPITYVINSLRTFIGLTLKTLLSNKDIINRYRDWLRIANSLQRNVDVHQPDMILLDEHLNFYVLFLKKISKKIVILNTKLSTKKRNNIPPLCDNFIPTDSLYSKVKCWLSWYRHILEKIFQTLCQKIVFFGKDDLYFERRIGKKNGNNRDRIFTFKNSFYDGLIDFPTLILAPRILEYKHYENDKNEFFFNVPSFRFESSALLIDYLRLKHKLISLQKQSDVKVVYAAFGTLTSEFQIIQSFIFKLLKVFEDKHNWYLLLAIGGLEEKLPIKSNVFYFEHAPQLDILTWSDVMISHGGLTTIKECLNESVPMLIYPLNKKLDQPGNASRVLNSNWGLVGDMVSDEVLSIYSKLSEVMTYSVPHITTDITLPDDFINSLLPLK